MLWWYDTTTIIDIKLIIVFYYSFWITFFIIIAVSSRNLSSKTRPPWSADANSCISIKSDDGFSELCWLMEASTSFDGTIWSSLDTMIHVRIFLSCNSWGQMMFLNHTRFRCKVLTENSSVLTRPITDFISVWSASFAL